MKGPGDEPGKVNHMKGYASESEARRAIVSAKQARREIARHGLSFDEFTAEKGLRENYRGATVLDWLGY